MANSGVAPVAHRLLPILAWIPGYRRDWLLPDVLAGLALWAVMVPEGMAYAGIVGVPPIMGLYTIVPALIAYALLGTSRQLVVGPDTATGLISSVTVGAIATQGTADFNSLTSTLAVLIGLFFLAFGLVRMGWVASFIPTPVMRGFIEGLVYVTIIGQVPHLLGISGASGNFFTKLWHVLQHLPDVSVAPALTGILSLAAMLLLRHFAPAVPAALVVMAVATILIGLLGGEATGVHVAAHGPANILSGLFGGFLVVGSLSKTSVATSTGARSQVANLVAAAFSFLTLLFLTPLFRNMPQPALAAIVIAAMLHLTRPSYLMHLFARSRWSFANAVIVIAGELTLGVLQGIALGVVLSILTLIYLTSHPKGAVLGQLPGTEAYRDVEHRPGAITFPGLLIWRVGGDLFFASIGHMRETLKATLAERPDVKRLLLDFAAVNFIDISAGDELSSLIKALQSEGITTGFVRVRDAVREDMRRAGIEAIVGPNNFYERTTDGVRDWQRQGSSSVG